MIIRSERRGDESAIHALTAAAFAPMDFSSNTEARIVDLLRRDGDLSLSLVAEAEGVVVGHVAFSPVTIGGLHGGWFGLGPISVRPDVQRQGIGKALVARGLELLRQMGACGCALIGNPAYYGRLGFESDGKLTYRDVDRRYVQWIVLNGSAPFGELAYARAFNVASDDES